MITVEGTKEPIIRLYIMVGEMTCKRVEKEKETKLSRLTLKMISLTQSLCDSVSRSY